MSNLLTQKTDSVGVTAIVTAYKQINKTIETIARIRKCTPPPDEILVHVDGNQSACAEALEVAFPEIRVIVNEQNVGPGGGRNLLLAEARNTYVASFDDDSYPLHDDYFYRIRELFERYPGASILAASIFHPGESMQNAPETDCAWVAAFGGGGCIYRRTEFMKTSGYVPLAVAYGMEEVDLSMRIIDTGGGILWAPTLRVFHDSDRSHHATPRINAFSIANIVLLVFLRYPVLFWPIGLAQLLRRLTWLVSAGRLKGIISGLLMIPWHLWTYRNYRQTIDPKSFRRIMTLRRCPKPVSTNTAPYSDMKRRIM